MNRCNAICKSTGKRCKNTTACHAHSHNNKRTFRFGAESREVQDAIDGLESLGIRSGSDCNKWLLMNHPDKIRNLQARNAFDIGRFTNVMVWCNKLKANERKNRNR